MDHDFDFEAIPQADLQADLLSIFRGAIKMTLESLLEEEIRAMVGAPRWARLAHRKDVRNGSYFRGLLTSMGHIDVRVPRTREQGAPTGVLDHYQRRQDEVDDLITSSYVNGVSTRKVGEVTEALLGERVGRSTVSRVSKSLEEQVTRFEKTPIPDPIPYLYLDATFLNARWARKVESISVLVAYGVDAKGMRTLLAITIGAEESKASWDALLEQLIERGLHGVELVIADAHAGIAAAVRHSLPEAKQQRCCVHLQRNVMTKAPQRLRARLAREVWKVLAAPDLATAKTRLVTFTARFAKELPEATECLQNGFAAATAYFGFPPAHWKKIRSTNGLERFHGEIKRRTRSVGAFPDRTSAMRLIVAVAIHATKTWKTRRYIGALASNGAEGIQQAA